MLIAYACLLISLMEEAFDDVANLARVSGFLHAGLDSEFGHAVIGVLHDEIASASLSVLVSDTLNLPKKCVLRHGSLRT